MAIALAGDWRYIDEDNPDAGVTNGHAFMSLKAFNEMMEQPEPAPPLKQSVARNRKQRRADRSVQRKSTKAKRAQEESALSMLMMAMLQADGPVAISPENVQLAKSVPLFLKCTPQPDGGLVIELKPAGRVEGT